MDRRMTKGRRLFFLTGNNRGNTLIEVIVCVLIIGIAFVPLMVGLNTSLRINKDTENKLYAENVASNIVEICKTYGVQGLSDLKTKNGDTVNGIKAFLAGDNVEVHQVGEDPEFYIEKISSGAENKVYYANVVFDDTNYASGQNDFSAYQSISGLSDAVVLGFGQDYVETVINRMTPYLKSELNAADLQSSAETWLKRRIIVEVKEVTVEEKTRYAVEGRIEYVTEDSSLFKDSDVTSIIYQSQPYESITVVKTGGSTTTPIGSAPEVDSYKVVPKSVVVTYSQLKDMAANKYLNLGRSTTRPYDLIVDMKVNGGSTNVYALCTDTASLNLSAYQLLANGEGYCGSSPDYTIGVYSNLNPIADPNDDSQVAAMALRYSNCKLLKQFGDGSTGKQSKLKDVTITIREDDASGREIVTKTSTVIELE